MRKPRPLQRTEGTKRDATLVVIASEDRYAVKQYFEFFRSSRVQFKVLETEDTRSSPNHVMDRLVAYMEEFDFGEGDQFWLVCDTDHWIDSGHIQNLRDVIRRCSQKGIRVALNNPCFELWLLLHFEEFPNDPITSCSDVTELLRKSVGGYDKKKVYRLPITSDLVARAITRARSSCDLSFQIPSTPQTSVFCIIDDFSARGIVTMKDQRS